MAMLMNGDVEIINQVKFQDEFAAAKKKAIDYTIGSMNGQVVKNNGTGTSKASRELTRLRSKTASLRRQAKLWEPFGLATVKIESQQFRAARQLVPKVSECNSTQGTN